MFILTLSFLDPFFEYVEGDSGFGGEIEFFGFHGFPGGVIPYAVLVDGGPGSEAALVEGIGVIGSGAGTEVGVGAGGSS